eukprot:Blabericola_migrator_1__2332@NODE_1650_length_4098_cov_100_711982_g1051_i1_p3_GENE_NODE_1650_length_4098_cov_100_711982_g1051_i1NODE_1650_length_4098_cov_100_711982_g1051_i1_p3_ORF_typecomplete_len110_score8_51_NODE_1650_length_4098_cov_100_711982_g1051_i130753404
MRGSIIRKKGIITHWAGWERLGNIVYNAFEGSSLCIVEDAESRWGKDAPLSTIMRTTVSKTTIMDKVVSITMTVTTGHSHGTTEFGKSKALCFGSVGTTVGLLTLSCGQ